MLKTYKTIRSDQQGFTLVELAIVLIIVGLLIGGILKGQELIGNAQVTAMANQLRSLEAATSGFRDQFAAIAGDVANANNRIAGCGGPPCFTAANTTHGNGILNVTVGAAPASTASEGAQYFNQLRAAGYISNLDGRDLLTFGQALPPAAIQGGYTAGDTKNATTYTGFTAAEFRPGVYVVATNAPADVAATTGSLTPSQMARIDRKIDDGIPSTGLLLSDTAVAACRLGTAPNFTYNEVSNSTLCSMAYRVQ